MLFAYEQCSVRNSTNEAELKTPVFRLGMGLNKTVEQEGSRVVSLDALLGMIIHKCCGKMWVQCSRPRNLLPNGNAHSQQFAARLHW
ncbi:hypothetical protein CEXT_402901 [Caerostris extrusa]|uniref:Uncharacterized protein n=1 Tax=Caerostris extrusa TaxID=172846 RepID=A0AAV4QR90_CAEEX|nr:hypothetical protein CEXT_402901 [Caerostris extrusa]